ncbi:hypothetical protein [Streptomyces sp. NBC_01304]|uniref:hypothetical protein n=1 Tax=Streptomyces sp. NBC_01304 TaxID=2903818 RepID=UPI002E165E13|nr:hypothetical protein OG430_47685 [Streptomyces sp. NBC_01304]
MSVAAELIAARLAGCAACQKKLSGLVMRGDKLVLAALAASLPHNPPQELREGTKVMYPALRTRSGFMIFGLIHAMPRRHRADVLADAVEYWVSKIPSAEAGTSDRAAGHGMSIELPAPAGPEAFPDGVVEIRRMGSTS